MSDIVRHAGKTGLRYFEWLCEESRAMRRFSKDRVARNRLRAEPAIVAEQLAHDAEMGEPEEVNLYDDTNVFYPGCEP